MLLKGLDDLVSVTGFFIQQGQDDQLEIAGAKHPGGAEALATHEAPKAPEKSGPAAGMRMRAVSIKIPIWVHHHKGSFISVNRS